MKPLFYTFGPGWWPYQLSNINRVSVVVAESVILDNGAFTYYQQGRRPSLDLWVSRLRLMASRLKRYVDEVVVVLPDWPKDPVFTLKAASFARSFFKDYRVMIVAHYSFGYPIDRVVEEALSLDVDVVGVPCKLYCTRKGRNRRVPIPVCQKTLVEIVSKLTRGYGVRVHALGLGLKHDIVSYAYKFIHSFDTTSWKRPINSRLPNHSVKNKHEMEQAFLEALRVLKPFIHVPDSILKTIEVI